MIKERDTAGSNPTIITKNTSDEYCFVGVISLVTKLLLSSVMVFEYPTKQIGCVNEYSHKLHLNKELAEKYNETKELVELTKTGINNI